MNGYRKIVQTISIDARNLMELLLLHGRRDISPISIYKECSPMRVMVMVGRAKVSM